MSEKEKINLIETTVEHVIADIRKNLGIEADYAPGSQETIRAHDVVQAINLTESEYLD